MRAVPWRAQAALLSCLRRAGLALAAALALSGTASAAAEERRMLAGAEAAAFRAVGRLDVPGAGFCTGTLISERLVLTAAHCLYNQRTGERIDVRGIRFVAGLHFEERAAVRRIVRAVEAPGFQYEGRPRAETLAADLALLELARPVAPTAAPPAVIGAPPLGEAALAVVSYGRDRSLVPSIHDSCPVRAMAREVAALGCRVVLGGSGGPVFVGTGGERRLVGVVSASGQGPAGMPLTLVVMVEPVLESLRVALASAEGDEP